MTAVYLSRPGVVTCAGVGLQALWRAVTAGDQSGIKRVRSLSGKEFYAGIVDTDSHCERAAYGRQREAISSHTEIASQAAQAGKIAGKTSLAPARSRRGRDASPSKIAQMTEAALQQMDGDIRAAIARYGAHRVAVCVGSCDNGAQASIAAHTAFVQDGSFPAGYTLQMQGAAEGAAYIASKYSITGPSLSFATACSSSATAIMRGAQLLLSGAADAVAAGGVDRASDIALLGFDSLEAVSGEKSNPFSVNRSGITLGDGAAFFVMTREKLADNAMTAISLLGMGETTDAHHMTAPDDTGEYAAGAMMRALDSAGITAGDVDYVNLHGTGTRQNDAMEARAMQKVFGENGVKCSSTKSVTGHTLGAAGAVELAVCYAALTANEDGVAVLPAQAWDGEADPALPQLDIINRGDEVKRPAVCMTNTFAFGGANASLIIGRETWKR